MSWDFNSIFSVKLKGFLYVGLCGYKQTVFILFSLASFLFPNSSAYIENSNRSSQLCLVPDHRKTFALNPLTECWLWACYGLLFSCDLVLIMFYCILNVEATKA